MNPASLDCTHSCSREGRLGSEHLACSHGAQSLCVGTAAHDLVLVWPACVLCAQSPPALALPLAILFLSSLPFCVGAPSSQSLAVCNLVLEFEIQISKTRNIGRKHLQYVAADGHADRQNISTQTC